MEITKIVITGGPCAGKTTGLSWIQNAFTQRGYTVLFVPETATEFISGGVCPWTCGTNVEYQKVQMELQLKKEQLFEQAAATMPADKILIVCDRGAMDNKAYMNDEEFAEVLDYLGVNEVELRDSYDAVFHLVTAASGAEEFYSLENNAARYETLEEARVLDDKLMASWIGHPHLKIIDNSTDFENKMKKLISEISSFLGEMKPYETEKKFLIEYPDLSLLESLPNCEKVEIVQTYLVSDPGEEIRVFRRGLSGHYLYYETRRKAAGRDSMVWIERRLSESRYEEMLEWADPSMHPVTKDRYCLADGNQYFEIDVYPFWNDRAIVEIELTDPNEEIRIPSMLRVIRDVSGEEEYKSSALARL